MFALMTEIIYCQSFKQVMLSSIKSKFISGCTREKGKTIKRMELS